MTYLRKSRVFNLMKYRREWDSAMRTVMRLHEENHRLAMGMAITTFFAELRVWYSTQPKLPANWAWFLHDTNVFHGGFTSREAAIADAYANGQHTICVGTVEKSEDAMVRMVNVHDIIEMIDVNMMNDADIYPRAGAQQALEAWVRTYLQCGSESVCLEAETVHLPTNQLDWIPQSNKKEM